MPDCLLEPCTLQHSELACGESLFEQSLCAPLLQIHAHYELKKSSRHRRNLAITGGVALSIITAPVIAAVSVGKNSAATSLFRFPIFHPGIFSKCPLPVTRHRRSHHVGLCVRCCAHLSVSGRRLRRQQGERPRRAHRLRRGRRTDHR